MEVPADELERLEEGPVQPHQRRVRRLGTQARVAAHYLARLQITLWSLCWIGEANNEVPAWVLPQILGAVSDEYDNTHQPLRIHFLAVRRPPDMLLLLQQQQEEEQQYVIEIIDHIHTSGAAGNGLPPDLLPPERRAGRFGNKRLDWSKLTVGFSFSVAAQMSVNILQSGGQSVVPSPSNGSAEPRHSDPVVMFQCMYGYPLAILSCLGFITVGHLIGGVKKFPPWVAAVATKSGIFMGGVGFVLALTAAFSTLLKYVTWAACCAASILAVFICRYDNHSRVC